MRWWNMHGRYQETWERERESLYIYIKGHIMLHVNLIWGQSKEMGNSSHGKEKDMILRSSLSFTAHPSLPKFPTFSHYIIIIINLKTLLIIVYIANLYILLFILYYISFFCSFNLKYRLSNLQQQQFTNNLVPHKRYTSRIYWMVLSIIYILFLFQQGLFFLVHPYSTKYIYMGI